MIRAYSGFPAAPLSDPLSDTARTLTSTSLSLGVGLLHLREPKDVGRSISCVDNGLHGFGLTAADSMLADPLEGAGVLPASWSPEVVCLRQS